MAFIRITGSRCTSAELPGSTRCDQGFAREWLLSPARVQIARNHQLERQCVGSSRHTYSDPRFDAQVAKKRGMSAAGRKPIAEAHGKRWAAVKGEPAAPEATKKPKRKPGAAGKANIVAALKKRWAAKRSAPKKAAVKNAA
jgi:hypothetical protein